MGDSELGRKVEGAKATVQSKIVLPIGTKRSMSAGEKATQRAYDAAAVTPEAVETLKKHSTTKRLEEELHQAAVTGDEKARKQAFEKLRNASMAQLLAVLELQTERFERMLADPAKFFRQEEIGQLVKELGEEG